MWKRGDMCVWGVFSSILCQIEPSRSGLIKRQKRVVASAVYQFGSVRS